jgi:hypothetical protein
LLDLSKHIPQLQTPRSENDDRKPRTTTVQSNALI